jgi:hypothetical protein
MRWFTATLKHYPEIAIFLALAPGGLHWPSEKATASGVCMRISARLRWLHTSVRLLQP